MITLGAQVKITFVLWPVSLFFLAALEPVHNKSAGKKSKNELLSYNFFNHCVYHL